MPELDAGCEPGLPHLEHIPDHHTPWLVLFASVLYSGRESIERRADEWRRIFGTEHEIDRLRARLERGGTSG
jgi:hypothetical protein